MALSDSATAPAPDTAPGMNAASCATPGAASDQRAQPPGKRRRRAVLALWLILGALILAIALGCAWLALQVPPAGLAAVQQRARQFRLIGVAVQLAALALAHWRWNALVAWAARRNLIGQPLVAPALAARHKAAGFTLAVIALVSIGPADLIGVFGLLMN